MFFHFFSIFFLLPRADKTHHEREKKSSSSFARTLSVSGLQSSLPKPKDAGLALSSPASCSARGWDPSGQLPSIPSGGQRVPWVCSGGDTALSLSLSLFLSLSLSLPLPLPLPLALRSLPSWGPVPCRCSSSSAAHTGHGGLQGSGSSYLLLGKAWPLKDTEHGWDSAL